MWAVLSVCLAVVPLLTGWGCLRILYGKQQVKAFSRGDWYGNGICVCLGVTEAAHLLAVLGSFRFHTCVKLIGLLFVICIVFCAGLWITDHHDRCRRFLAAGWEKLTGPKEVTYHTESSTCSVIRKSTKTADQDSRGLHRVHSSQSKKAFFPGDTQGQMLFLLLGISVLLQCVIIWTGEGFYQDTDLTLETVQTFLAEDGIYTVNPLTGQAYTLGIPLRLKILSLPTLYGFLSQAFSVEAVTVVGMIVPTFTLLAAYLSYAGLGRSLFGENQTARLWFLLAVSALLWLGGYLAETDSFQLLYCGYRGSAIRAGILLPLTFRACLEKRWRLTILYILAEACILWTLYGMGLCLLVTAVMLLLTLVQGRLQGGRRHLCGKS